MGHSIIVGRGGNEITRGFPNVVSVRMIGSEKNRIAHMIHVHGMTDAGARKFIKEEDAGRRRFLKQHFGTEIDDPMRYDLVINTDHFDDETVVEMLLTALEAKGNAK
jgi:cytidylate kinase